MTERHVPTLIRMIKEGKHSGSNKEFQGYRISEFCRDPSATMLGDEQWFKKKGYHYHHCMLFRNLMSIVDGRSKESCAHCCGNRGSIKL